MLDRQWHESKPIQVSECVDVFEINRTTKYWVASTCHHWALCVAIDDIGKCSVNFNPKTITHHSFVLSNFITSVLESGIFVVQIFKCLRSCLFEVSKSLHRGLNVYITCQKSLTRQNMSPRYIAGTPYERHVFFQITSNSPVSSTVCSAQWQRKHNAWL